MTEDEWKVLPVPLRRNLVWNCECQDCGAGPLSPCVAQRELNSRTDVVVPFRSSETRELAFHHGRWHRALNLTILDLLLAEELVDEETVEQVYDAWCGLYR